MPVAMAASIARVTHPSAAFAAFGIPTVRKGCNLLYSTSPAVTMGHGSHASDNDPHVLQQEKARNLRGATPELVPGAPGHNPALASESEAVVHAERAPSMSIEALQEHTIKVVQHLHHGAEMETPPEVHDPSSAPAIRDNLQYSADKKD